MSKTPPAQWLFATLAVTLAVIGLLWMSLLPPFQGADESVHFSQSVLWREWAATGFQDISAAQTECQGVLMPLLEAHRVAALRFNPMSSYAAPLTDSEFSYFYFHDFGCSKTISTPLYYLTGALLTAVTSWSDIVSFYALRLWSLALFLATLYVAYRCGLMIFSKWKEALLLPIFLGIQPLMVVTGITVGPDVLVNFFFALAFFVAFSFMLKKGLFADPERFLSASVVLTLLAFFTKPVGALIPVFLLLALVISKRWRPLSFGLLGLLIVGTVTFLFFRSQYSPPLSALYNVLYPSASGVGETFRHLFWERWAVLFESFWGGWGSGWLDVHAPPVFLAFFAVLMLVGLIGALLSLGRRPARHKSLKPTLLFCLSVLVVFELVSIVYNAPTATSDFPELWFAQGRYYFPVAIPLFVLILKGWQTIFPPIPFYRLMYAWILFLLIFHFTYMGTIVVPRFYF